MATTGVRRVVRGSVAAVLSTFVALLSHVAGGGVMPTVAGIAVPLLVSIAVCTVLTGRRLALPRLAAAVLASQGLFHALFTVGAPTAIVAVAGSTSGAESAHVHSVVLTEVAAHGHSTGTSMWWTHAIAALVTIVAVRRGEDAVRRLLAVARVVVGRFAAGRLARARAIRPVSLRRAIRSAIAVRPRRARRLDTVVARSRRGPPLAAAV